MTQGQGTGRVYPTILQTLVNIPVQNYGGGGDKVQDIFARTNTYPAILTQDVTIPANGSVSLGNLVSCYDNSRKINVALENSAMFHNVEIMGIKGILSVRGSYENAVYTFTRNGGSAAMAVKAGTPVLDSSVDDMKKSSIMVLWCGTNGLWEDEKDLAQMLRRIVDNMGISKFIVVGLTNRNYHYDQYTYCEFTPSVLKSTMLKEFGIHYIDTLGYLLTDALTDAGITPTQQDLEAIADENVPPSLLADSVHFNATGYNLIANLIHNKLQQLNYL